jgi:kynurenine formamidase
MMAEALKLALVASISNFQVVDLTHLIDETVCVWDGSCGFTSELTGDYNTGGFRGQKFTMRSCLGTHMDSPAHCFEGAPDCSTMKIENCVVPAYVVDVSSMAHEDYAISLDDIKQFESRYGEIKQGSLVFFATGWSKRWKDQVSFRNEKEDGIPHFPHISAEVAQFLLTRGVAGVGIDTCSPDPFHTGAPVHKLILGVGKYIIENVANLESMPPVNSYVIALPLKISGGAESPIRLVGLVSK